MTSQISSRLKKAGLSEKAALVYTALMEHGGAYPSRIAELTHLKRSTVYKVLTELAINGLVQEIQKGKKLFYQAHKPAAFLKHAKERLELAQDAYVQSERVLPDLEHLYSLMPDKPKMQYFKGIKEVMSIYADQIAVDKPYEMLTFGNGTAISMFLPTSFYKKYRKEKALRKVITRGILTDTPFDRTYIEKHYYDTPVRFRPKIRFMPADKFPFQGEITIYGTNKVSIINLNENNLTGLIIEDPSFNQAMRTIFELAWLGAER